MKRALISVSNKEGIIEFARELTKLGIEIISTGGTYSALIAEGIQAVPVESVTGFKECLDGRVKTLHPHIHGAILAVRDHKTHMDEIKAMGIDLIDLVVVNLYPFKQTILKEGSTLDEAIENIDIGGPAMIRSAAKNYNDTAVITDPLDYDQIIEEMKSSGHISKETRFSLSAKAFAHTAHYDSLIASYLGKKAGLSDFGPTLTLSYEKVQDLRYGENPHQKGAFYKEVGNTKGCLTKARQLQGKEISFNNINDTQGALALLKELEQPAVVAVKHANPCGVGKAEDLLTAYKKAYACDPVSIYGGIIALNRIVDDKTASEIIKCFTEIVIAPDYTPEALLVFKAKKNLRVLVLEDILAAETGLDLKKVSGGILVQNTNNVLLPEAELKYVTKRKPTDQEMNDLFFAWKVVKHTKSNSIVICKDGQTVGLGIGQVNRVWACEQAISHGKEFLPEKVKGSVLASDAYFPFDDGVKAAAQAGISAMIQPGGSIHDADAIKMCDDYNVAMVMTGMRHFRH